MHSPVDELDVGPPEVGGGQSHDLDGVEGQAVAEAKTWVCPHHAQEPLHLHHLLHHVLYTQRGTGGGTEGGGGKAWRWVTIFIVEDCLLSTPPPPHTHIYLFTDRETDRQ